MTTEQISRRRRQDKKSSSAHALRYAALLPLALLVVASLPRAATATYSGLTSNRIVVNTRGGPVWVSARRPAQGGTWTRGSTRPTQDERVRHDDSQRRRGLPLLAGRSPGDRNLGGTAVRSAARSLAARTALLQRPLRDITARPLLQQVADCRRSASQSHRLRAPPSFAR